MIVLAITSVVALALVALYLNYRYHHQHWHMTTTEWLEAMRKLEQDNPLPPPHRTQF